MSEKVSTREAARLLGFSHHQSVLKLIERGQIAATWNEAHTRQLIDLPEIERYNHERRPAHRPRKDRPMKAIEIELETGTYYIPLQTYDHGKVLIPMDNGQRVLSPTDIRVNWDAWVSDLIPWSKLLTREQLDAEHPGIEIDHE